MTNRERFAEVYEVELARAVVEYPDEYGWPVADVPRVAAKMMAAVDGRSFNKDGRAFKATCKALGIRPFTYKAIHAYLDEGGS